MRDEWLGVIWWRTVAVRVLVARVRPAGAARRGRMPSWAIGFSKGCTILLSYQELFVMPGITP
jgi:hypothetical protein